jgi:hypothetical protein
MTFEGYTCVADVCPACKFTNHVFMIHLFRWQTADQKRSIWSPLIFATSWKMPKNVGIISQSEKKFFPHMFFKSFFSDFIFSNVNRVR